ncbi:hypothetical protein BY458DRAFT_530340 [Sporodiniella umbellata]|nr:hypothetical protein BY458DRAFT_530340 [Sporodiniella umbellata]
MHLLVTQLNLQFSEWLLCIKKYSSTTCIRLYRLPKILSTLLSILWEFQSFRLIAYTSVLASAIPIILLLLINILLIFTVAILHGTLWMFCTLTAVGFSFFFLLPIAVSSVFLTSIFVMIHAWLCSVTNSRIRKYPKYGVHNGEVVKY